MEAIPAEVLTQLIGLRPVLEHDACVQRHGNGWRVRFRFEDKDGRRQRSITLGENECVAAAAREVIRGWRQERAEAEAQRELVEEAARRERRELAVLRKIVELSCNGGRRRRRQIREWFDSIQNDHRAMLRFCLYPQLPPPRRPGRPRKARLW